MPGGRPTKLTPAVQARIVAHLRAGNYIETAAAAAGITKETLYDWLRRGAAETFGPHRQFSDAVQEAQAAAETDMVRLVATAAKEQWQAAAWHLERKFPDRWGRRTEVTVDVKKDAAESTSAMIAGFFGTAEAGSDASEPAGDK